MPLRCLWDCHTLELGTMLAQVGKEVGQVWLNLKEGIGEFNDAGCGRGFLKDSGIIKQLLALHETLLSAEGGTRLALFVGVAVQANAVQQC